MNDIPDAAELLAIARSTLLDKLLAHVPEDSRYDALMIANAMAIAARELASGAKAQQEELARLRALFGERTKPIEGDALAVAIAGYRKRLAAEIRSGRFDGNERATLLSHLDATAADELAICNPKALEGR